MTLRERRLSSETVFKGKILTVRLDEVEAADGYRGTREVVDHPGAVGVVAVHGEDVVLVRQWRYAPERELLEIPAGKLSGGEDPRACARRELVEEVGLRPRSLDFLAAFYTTPGFSNERFHLFFADDLVEEAGHLDEGEVLVVERHPVASVRELLPRIEDSKTLIGLTLLALRLGL